jgi:hypothetical protein
VLRDAFAKTKKMAVGQLIMHGREHLVGITAHMKGLMLVILRYADELRKPEAYFDKIETNKQTPKTTKGCTPGIAAKAVLAVDGSANRYESIRCLTLGEPRAKGGARWVGPYPC